MLENRVASPEILAEEAIRKNPTEAYKRMKADQEKITQLQTENKELEDERGTLIYCTVLVCANNIQLVGCPEGQGMCSIESIHLQGCTPDADNILGCSEFTEQALKSQAQRCCSLNTQRAETEIDDGD